MSTDLEELIRRTLRARAAEVEHGPAWSGPPSEREGVRTPVRRRWPVLLAAALVVTLVGVGAWVARTVTRPDGARPVPVATPVPPPVQATCAATLPAAWGQALQSARVEAGGRTAMPLSVSTDGAVVALRDLGVTPGSKRQVVAVTASRATVATVLYDVPDPDHFTAAAAYYDGHTLLVGLAASPRPPRGTVPGGSAIGLRAVVAVDVAAKQSRVLAGSLSTEAGSGAAISALAYLDGTGYWDTEAHYGADVGSVQAFDFASGTVHTVYQGAIGWPLASAAGIGWSDKVPGGFRFVVTHGLPGPVEQAMTPFARPRLATDGTTYAWYASVTVLGWWQPGRSMPTYLRLKTPVDPERVLGGPLVSGDYVVGSAIVDVATRATAPLPTTGLYGESARGEFLFAHGSVLGGLAFGGEPGKFLDGYWADTPVEPLRVDLSGLPRFAC